jgi:POT family proton-dependent oligopeptide transporter
VWERFAFFGMQALLMLYMTKYLLLPEHARSVLGLAQFRGALSATVGPMTDLAFAAQTYGIYSGLTYASPLVGAWLGDRVLGKTRTVTIGTLLMAAGHLLMASEHFFLVAMLLLVLGAGCLVGNMAAQVGQLYAPDDHRRTRAFGLYLAALNVGALLAPLVIGSLGEKSQLAFGIWRRGRRHAYRPRDLSLRPSASAARHDHQARPIARGSRAASGKTIGVLLLMLVPVHPDERRAEPSLRHHVRLGRQSRRPNHLRVANAGDMGRHLRRRDDDRRRVHRERVLEAHGRTPA